MLICDEPKHGFHIMELVFFYTDIGQFTLHLLLCNFFSDCSYGISLRSPVLRETTWCEQKNSHKQSDNCLNYTRTDQHIPRPCNCLQLWQPDLLLDGKSRLYTSKYNITYQLQSYLCNLNTNQTSRFY